MYGAVRAEEGRLLDKRIKEWEVDKGAGKAGFMSQPIGLALASGPVAPLGYGYGYKPPHKGQRRFWLASRAGIYRGLVGSNAI